VIFWFERPDSFHAAPKNIHPAELEKPVPNISNKNIAEENFDSNQKVDDSDR
jgi:hypothetical protein